LRVGIGARIGGQAGVMADVPPRADVVGSPAQPVKAFFKEVAIIRRWVRNGGIPASTDKADLKNNLGVQKNLDVD